MIRRHVVTSAALLPLAWRPRRAVAQQPNAVECPSGLACVLYDGVTIAIDPAAGPYQVIVVEEQEIRATTLAGAEVRQAVVGAGFLRRADGSYVFDQTFTKAKAGPFADAQLEDVYVLGPADS